jgi:hypothetical protein
MILLSSRFPLQPGPPREGGGSAFGIESWEMEGLLLGEREPLSFARRFRCLS